MFSFRDETSSHLLASPSSSSWSLGERERQSIPGEAGGGVAGEKESRARQRGRESERAERRRRRGGRVAPHILLISVSIVVSVGTPSLRARGAAKGGEGPSIILSSVSLTSHSLSSSSSSSYPLLLAPVVSDLSRSLHRRSLKTLATMTSFPLKREGRCSNKSSRALLRQFRNFDDKGTQTICYIELPMTEIGDFKTNARNRKKIRRANRYCRK